MLTVGFKEKMMNDYVLEVQKHVKSKYNAENLNVFVFLTSYNKTSAQIDLMLDDTVRKI